MHKSILLAILPLAVFAAKEPQSWPLTGVVTEEWAVAVNCHPMLYAAAGYDDTVKKAESIGIIGGEDGPTAVWILDDKVWWLDPKPIVFKTLVANPCSSPADAARMAERIFVDIYGKGVLSERPWRVTDTNGCYFVCGTLPDGFLGGVAQLKLEKADGMVWIYLHGK